ncbi:MAG: SAM-dependent methyltransferase [Verrucomicrobia bacterium]|nr:SAM-dependent methyltransferase [Verrucomicrobiota bacterium]
MYKADTEEAAGVLENAAESVQAYTMPAWWYCVRGWLLVQFVYRSSIHRQIRFFARNISGRHLDVPIGEGTLLSLALLWRKICRKPQAQITGVDYSRNMVERATENFEKDSNIKVQWGDVGRLPFEAGSFASVNIPNGFHCFPDPEGALKELHRVLAPGGTLAANILLHPRGPGFMRWLPETVNARAIRKGDLNRTFDLDDVLQTVREHGFVILEKRIDGNTLYLVAQKPGGSRAPVADVICDSVQYS